MLLADYILRRRRAAGSLTAEHYLVKTLVTTDMVRRLAEHYRIRAMGDVLTGFKWIGGVIDDLGPEKFVFGYEEAHGYLVGDYIRDKDAAGAAMLLAELAAELKARQLTLHQELQRLHKLVGYHAEHAVARTLPGSTGLAQMSAIMQRLRERPPTLLGGQPVRAVRDYLAGMRRQAGGKRRR